MLLEELASAQHIGVALENNMANAKEDRHVDAVNEIQETAGGHNERAGSPVDPTTYRPRAVEQTMISHECDQLTRLHRL